MITPESLVIVMLIYMVITGIIRIIVGAMKTKKTDYYGGADIAAGVIALLLVMFFLLI